MINLPENSPTPSRIPISVVLIVCTSAFVGGLFTMQLWSMMSERFETADVVIDKKEDSVVVVEDGLVETKEAVVVSAEGDLAIDWIDPSQQEKVDNDALLVNVLCPGWDGDEEFPLCGNPLQFSQIRLGTVVGGVYDGMYLELATARVDELGYSHRMLYVLKDPLKEKASVILDSEGKSAGESYSSLATYTATEMLAWRGLDILEELPDYVIEKTAQLSDLIPEEMIQDKNGNRFFLSGAWVRFDVPIASSILESTNVVQLSNGRELIGYEAGDGASTQAGKNQYYLINKDGRVLWYDLEVKFFDYAMQDDTPILSQGVPYIIWNDGSKNEQTYIKGSLGGCGFTTLTNVVSQEIVEDLNLIKVGNGTYDASDMVTIYEPDSYETEYFTDAFNLTTWSHPDDEPISYDTFDHAYVYFQDAFDRWVELVNFELIPPVECGKPVIYLYPEIATEMSVWVSPRGGFSYTEPEYGDGWNVKAYPDGHIVNKEDSITYPYLFWEGRGGLYPQVETYWVVEQEEVESFIDATLAKMNLRENEIADFLEFWLPRMQDSKYYKIGFHGTSVMNELAPLSLSVQPDHVFRVLMDYQALDEWEQSRPPTRLPRANREGFEVVEWGGVLR